MHRAFNARAGSPTMVMQNYKVNSTFLTLQVFYFRKVQFLGAWYCLSLGLKILPQGLKNQSQSLKIQPQGLKKQSQALSRKSRRFKKLPQGLTQKVAPDGPPGVFPNVKDKGRLHGAKIHGFIGPSRAPIYVNTTVQKPFNLS